MSLSYNLMKEKIEFEKQIDLLLNKRVDGVPVFI
jgi:hypothetical protein